MALSPEQALAHLDEAAAKFQGTRQDHLILQQSAQVLTAALSELAALKAAAEVRVAHAEFDLATSEEE